MAPCFNPFNFQHTIFVIYVLFIVTVTATITSTESLLSLDEECLALFQFKQSILPPTYASFRVHEFHKFTSWKLRINSSDNGSSCCLWDGVLCSNKEHGHHVIGLDLSESFLRGPINSSNTLFNLVHLQRLNLAMNDFVESQIPSEIGRLKQLRSLNLSDSGFCGQIPNEISQLMHLLSLDLSLNPVKLQSPSLENLVQNLTGLEELDLSGVDISSSLPRFLANFSSLRSIKLKSCSLQGEFPTAILQLPKLKILLVANNTNLAGVLPEFRNNSLLEVLNLSSTSFSGIIPESINNLNHLIILGLNACYFFGHIPSSFMNLTQLRRIDLGKNQLEGPISSSFSNFKSLQSLKLYSNNFSGMVNLDIFTGLNKLQDLFLSYNIMTFVSNNYTNDTLPELKNLGLASCNLKEFPPFLRFQNKMRTLFLRDNEIDGLIPVWIWNNSQETLQTIVLSSNFITGFHHHPQILPWVRLEAFSIIDNELRGWLPVPAQTTIAYYVSYNKLTGEIPMWICELTSLRLLDLSSNTMTGTLPPCLGSLSSSLWYLNLRRNNFQGTMMNTFTHGSTLKMIDLSENQFWGQLSKSLANCTNLEFLSLGDNSFDDVFPFWLVNLTELQVLNLRSNKFHGAIHDPTTISSQFPKLQIIDLSNNSFSGQLPEKYFQSWNAMKSVYVGKSHAKQLSVYFPTYISVWSYSTTLTNKGVKTRYQKILDKLITIDLSSNNFEGEIPRSLQDLQGLESLNLSYNHFNGCVLPSLGKLKNLESLDLSQNKLSGEIPQQLLQLGFLSILNLSFNNLDGRIPHGKQFNTFENNSYEGNPKLCGEPLTKECQNSKASPTSTSNKSESLLPCGIVDWIVIFSGVGGGLVVGFAIGDFLNTRYIDKRFTERKERSIRPLGNGRRNQGYTA